MSAGTREALAGWLGLGPPARPPRRPPPSPAPVARPSSGGAIGLKGQPGRERSGHQASTDRSPEAAQVRSQEIRFGISAGPSGRRLTERQAAVLATVERLGRPMMADLWKEFPDLAPSAIRDVPTRLEKRGLVDHAGEPRSTSMACTGGRRP